MNLSRLPSVARRFSGPIAAAMCVSAAVLVWIGYRSVGEWEDAARAGAAIRAQIAADLLASAVARDMRGLQQVVLAMADRDGLVGRAPIDLLPTIGSAFARYPYPEAFFSWQGDAAPEAVSFYARLGRVPEWLRSNADRRLAPVVQAREPGVARDLLARVKRDGLRCKRASVFDTRIGEAPYQVVAVISYGQPQCDHVTGALGFLVNMEWVDRSYFADIANEIARLDSGGAGARLLVLDEQKRPVAGGHGEPALPTSMATHSFPLAFFDPLLVELDPQGDLQIRTWTAAAIASDDPALAAAEAGARKTLIIDAATSFCLLMALLVSARVARASADLAEMRTEFVSTVTHELKTPISNIRAINETLASGRGGAEISREYSEMAVSEAKRLGRLVDNLLAYAKITDITDAYLFEDVRLDAVVKDTVAEWNGQLQQARFTVDVAIPADMPTLHADPTALGLVISNLIDNAIRYSADDRRLRIAAALEGGRVRVEVSDHGIGIPHDEIARVTRKFFRGRSSHSGGSGLGLAIVDRIVSAHSGTLAIRSEVGRGTTVAFTIPRAVTA